MGRQSSGGIKANDIDFAGTLSLMHRYVRGQEAVDPYSSEALLGSHMIAIGASVRSGELDITEVMAQQFVAWAASRDLLKAL
jgi:hypothetical protein